MKHSGILFVAVLLLFTGTTLSAGNPPAGTDVKITTMTVADLKCEFGDNIVLNEGIVLDDETATVVFARVANPCNDFPDFDLCGPVAAAAGRGAREYANTCCCDVIYGYECCDPSSGPISVLALASPTHCK